MHALVGKRAQRLGEQFRSSIRSLRSPLVKEVRGRGLFNAIVIDESASSRGRTAWQFCLLLKSRGVLAKPTHVNMYVFPLRIGEGDADELNIYSLKVFASHLHWSSPRRTFRTPSA